MSGSRSGAHPGSAARLLAGRRRELRALASVHGGRDRHGERQRRRIGRRAPLQLQLRRRRKRRTCAAATTRTPTATPTRSSTSPPSRSSNRRSSPSPPARPRTSPGYLFAAPYAGPGAAGPDDLRRNRLARLVPPAAERRRSRQPAGADARRQPRAHVVAGLHRAPGLRRGRRGHRRLLLPPGRAACARATATSPTCTTSTSPRRTRRLLTAFNPLRCDLSAAGGSSSSAVTDSLFQELDLRTGLVRREWHSLDHVAFGSSYFSARGPSLEWPFDYFHLNSIEQGADGSTLISARNTWALYELNTRTGKVITTIGGRHSNVKLGPGAGTAYQHDASAARRRRDRDLRQRRRAEGALAVARRRAVGERRIPHRHHRDAVPAPHAAARGQPGQPPGAPQQRRLHRLGRLPLLLRVQPLRPAALRRAHARLLPVLPRLPLPVDGRPQLRARDRRERRLGCARSCARAGTATRAPRPGACSADPRSQQLAPVAGAPRAGFETPIAVPGAEPYVAVQALDAAGNVLGTSPVIRG